MIIRYKKELKEKQIIGFNATSSIYELVTKEHELLGASIIFQEVIIPWDV